MDEGRLLSFFPTHPPFNSHLRKLFSMVGDSTHIHIQDDYYFYIFSYNSPLSSSMSKVKDPFLVY